MENDNGCPKIYCGCGADGLRDVISALADRPTQTVPRATSKTGHSKNLNCPRVRVQLKLQSPDGKYCHNRLSQTPESLFRIIQSIPRKAEPFERWLAKVGYELVRGARTYELAAHR